MKKTSQTDISNFKIEILIYKIYNYKVTTLLIFFLKLYNPKQKSAINLLDLYF